MHTSRFHRAILASLLITFILTALPANAQIYNWNTGEVIPGTENTTPGPGIVLSGMYWDLCYADLSGGLDLHDSDFHYSWLDNSRFNGANLSGVDFYACRLTNADLTGATVTGTRFSCTYLTKEQLYSTASYQLGDLHKINLNNIHMEGWNFANKNLTGASLIGHFDDTDFTGAMISDANFCDTNFTKEQLYSTASYISGDLHGIELSQDNLIGWNFSNQNMVNASFCYSYMTDADLTGATITGLDFSLTYGRGFVKEQLYSTASYQNGYLHNVNASYNDLTDWNLENQNLTNATFYRTAFTNTILSRADLRGAMSLTDGQLDSAITDNMIHPNGHILGLNLGNEQTLRIWDYNEFTDSSGELHPAIPITIEDQFALASASTIEFLFEDDDWGSTITLESDILADLDGSIFLGFAPDADVDALLGTTFNLFNWNGTLPRGASFASVTWPAWADWDITDLYQGGTVTLTAVPEPATLTLLALAALSIRKRR